MSDNNTAFKGLNLCQITIQHSKEISSSSTSSSSRPTVAFTDPI